MADIVYAPQKAVDRVEKKVDQYKANQDTILEGHNIRIKNLEEEKTYTRQKLDEFNTKISTIKGGLDSLENTMETVISTTNRNTEEVQSFMKMMLDFRGEMQATGTEVMSIHEDVAEIKIQLSDSDPKILQEKWNRDIEDQDDGLKARVSAIEKFFNGLAWKIIIGFATSGLLAGLVLYFLPQILGK